MRTAILIDKPFSIFLLINDELIVPIASILKLKTNNQLNCEISFNVLLPESILNKKLDLLSITISNLKSIVLEDLLNLSKFICCLAYIDDEFITCFGNFVDKNAAISDFKKINDFIELLEGKKKSTIGTNIKEKYVKMKKKYYGEGLERWYTPFLYKTINNELLPLEKLREINDNIMPKFSIYQDFIINDEWFNRVRYNINKIIKSNKKFNENEETKLPIVKKYSTLTKENKKLISNNSSNNKRFKSKEEVLNEKAMFIASLLHNVES